MSNEREQRANDRARVAMLLVDEVAKAKCWDHVKRATDALFHANLLWKGYDREYSRFEHENDDCTEREQADD